MKDEEKIKDMERLLSELTVLADKYTDDDDDGLMKILVATTLLYGWVATFIPSEEKEDELVGVIMGERGYIESMLSTPVGKEGANEEA